jgi:hypothetical protein
MSVSMSVVGFEPTMHYVKVIGPHMRMTTSSFLTSIDVPLGELNDNLHNLKNRVWVASFPAASFAFTATVTCRVSSRARDSDSKPEDDN